jgi:hypothetical protein
MALSVNIVWATDEEFAKWWLTQDSDAIVDIDGQSNYHFSSMF